MRIGRLALVLGVTSFALVLISCGGSAYDRQSGLGLTAGSTGLTGTGSGGSLTTSSGSSTGGSTTSSSTGSSSTTGSGSSSGGDSGSSTGSSSSTGGDTGSTGASTSSGGDTGSTGSSSSTGGDTGSTGGTTDGGSTGLTTTTTTTGGTTGLTTGGTDGGTTGGWSDSTGGTTGLTTGTSTTTGGTTGLTTGGTDGGSSGGSTGGDIVVPSDVTFNVTVQGQVGRVSMTNFTISGQLHVAASINTPGTPNGVNPRDLVLSCGNPTFLPQTGAIRLATNQELYEVINLASLGSLVPLDDCFVDVDDVLGTVGIQLSSAQALLVGLNGFNASGGFGATVFKPQTGTLNLTFSADGQSLSGSINIQAKDILNRTWTYSATITGTLAVD